MSFVITLQQFEGPLDLMLHLIKEKELDLFDLDIHILTDQYLEYINKMEEMHLEVASEYLLELAGLIEYKSKKLLPKDESVLLDEFQEDPKERLIRRLLEYQQFKEVSSTLEDYYQQRALQLSKPMVNQAEEWMKNTEPQTIDGTPYELVKAMSKCMRREALSRPLQTKITQKELSVDDRILQLKVHFSLLPETFSFENLVEDCLDQHGIIVTFLAILDLIRLKSLVFTIDDEEMIWFKRGHVHG